MIHPFPVFWRARRRNPYRILIPLWIAMWIGVGAITWTWRGIVLYNAPWSWFPAALIFAAGVIIYIQSLRNFGGHQLGGVPEVVGGNRQQRLITTGIRSRVRHPVYLGHFCEMLAWNIGSGLAVTYALTVVAVITGAIMIQMEDRELERRFGQQYRAYRDTVPTVLPRLRSQNLA